MTWAITIMKIAGGTSMPIAVPAAISEAESRAVVAGLGERRHQRRAERRDLGHLRAADVGEEIGDHDHRHAEPALDPADQRAREARPARGSCRSAPSGCRRTRRRGWRAAPSSASPTPGRGQQLQSDSRRSTGRRRRRRRARTRSASRAGSARRRSTATANSSMRSRPPVHGARIVRRRRDDHRDARRRRSGRRRPRRRRRARRD